MQCQIKKNILDLFVIVLQEDTVLNQQIESHNC